MQYSKFFTLHSIAIVLSIVFLCSATSVLAQNESGVRPWHENGQDLRPNIYGERTNPHFKFYGLYPIIRNFPPIHSGMPWDVLIGYIVLDSVLRSAPMPLVYDDDSCRRSALSEMIGNAPLNDSLWTLYKYAYLLMDYDPIALMQYGLELDMRFPYLSRYKQGIGNIREGLRLSRKRAFPNKKIYDRYWALFESTHILRVRIEEIDSNISRGGTIKYGVRASVLDTIKGRRFADCNSLTISPTAKSSSEPCVMLTHLNSLQRSIGVTALYPICAKPRYRWPDYYSSPFFRGPNGFRFQIGQEVIVFVDISPLAGMHEEYDLLAMDIDVSQSSGAIYIDENNMVHDPNNIWSEENVLPYSQWKAIVQQHINNILTKNYGE